MPSCAGDSPASVAGMRCLIIITRSELGGAQRHVLELLRDMGQRHQLMLACGDSGWLVDQARQMGIPCIVVPDLVHPLHPVKDFSAFRFLCAFIRKWRPDVVHAHSSKAGVIARIAARAAGVPSVFTAHGWAFQPSYPAVRRVIALTIERLAASISGGPIICVSRFDRDLAVARHFPRAQLRLAHNGLPDLEEVDGVDCGDVNRVLMVARFSAPKDHESLIRAAVLVPKIHLQLIGDGPDQQRMLKLANMLRLSDRCHFHGAVDDVPRRLRGAGIFVLSSRTEGLPVCIIEAMRAGLPVIASAVGGIPELVEDGVTGILVPPADPAALANALARLVEDPELARSMGKAGRRRFLDHFQQTTMLAAIEQAWSDAVAGGSARWY